MAKRRVTLYLDSDVHQNVTLLLSKSPTPYPLSRLVDELLGDWSKVAEGSPRLADMTPAEQEAFIYRQAFINHRMVTDEAEAALRQIREGDSKT
jgi:hypothetical protein